MIGQKVTRSLIELTKDGRKDHFFCCTHLVSLGIAESLLLHAQVTHLGHELVWVDEEARAEQEGEDV